MVFSNPRSPGKWASPLLFIYVFTLKIKPPCCTFVNVHNCRGNEDEESNSKRSKIFGRVFTGVNQRLQKGGGKYAEKTMKGAIDLNPVL